MKITVLIGIAVIAMLVVTKAAVAADYQIGLKVWANTWSETIHPQTGDSQTLDNGSAIMTGPSLSVRVADKWFVNAAYLTTLGAYESTDWIVPEDTMKFRRSDLDIRVGRLFRPPFLFRPDPGVTFGVYLGYKVNDAPALYTNPASGVRNVHVGTWKQKGPGLGFLADISLNQSTSIYGDLAFFSLKQEFIAFQNVQPQSLHASGTVYEFGVARTITESLSATVGIKGEHSAVTEESGDVDGNDFIGLIAGIAYAW